MTLTAIAFDSGEEAWNLIKAALDFLVNEEDYPQDVLEEDILETIDLLYFG